MKQRADDERQKSRGAANDNRSFDGGPRTVRRERDKTTVQPDNNTTRQ